MSPERVSVTVDGRVLSLSNLDKVLYPTGFTKGEVIDYYTRVAPTLLPHLANRPLTVKRYPEGVEAAPFFQKNAPAGTPSWVRTVRLPAPGSTKDRETIDYPLVADLPTLVWSANLAALELHVPMWRVDDAGAPRPPDQLVFDLDPGPPATVVECCRVAEALAEVLAEDGLAGLPKTSGSKGLQVYVGLVPEVPWQAVHGYARAVAERLERERPELVVSNMRKDLRGGKVLVDWSQNNAAKTTVAPYSLRARPAPTVSTPVHWSEVRACTSPDELVFTAPQALARLDASGDLFAPLLTPTRRLPAGPAPR